MTIAERLQKAYEAGRQSAGLQIWEHLQSVAESAGEHLPLVTAALKYAAEAADDISRQESVYEETND